jgi:hypothetical protein
LESHPSYSRKILAGNFHEEADRHTFKDQRRKLARKQSILCSKERGRRDAEEETLKILVHFSRIVKD